MVTPPPRRRFFLAFLELIIILGCSQATLGKAAQALKKLSRSCQEAVRRSTEPGGSHLSIIGFDRRARVTPVGVMATWSLVFWRLILACGREQLDVVFAFFPPPPLH